MKEMCVLAVDVGTSSCKAAVCSHDGTVLEVCKGYYNLHSRGDGRVEQDPAEIIAGVQTAVASLAEICGGLHAVKAVSFSAQISAQCLVDREGRPITPILSWMDQRAAKEAQMITSRYSQESLKKMSGIDMVVTPAYGLSKLMWLRRHAPDLLERTYLFVQIKELIIHELTGEWVTDPDSAKGLIDQRTLKPAEELLEYVGADPGWIPPVKHPWEPAGYLRPGVRGFETVPAGIPVVTGWNDMNAAYLGMGGLPDLAVGLDLTGTSEHLGILYKKNEQTKSSGSIGGINKVDFLSMWEVCYGVTNTAGKATEWFCRQIVGTDDASGWFETLKETDLQDELLFIPYLFGERNPVYMSSGNGAFLNIGPDSGLNAMGMAVLEGICFALRMIYDRLPSAPREMIIGGGMSGNGRLNQLKADIFNLPVHQGKDREAGCRGAALLALAHLKEIDLSKRIPYTITKSWYPDPDRTAPEEEKYQRFLAVLRNSGLIWKEQ